jgi:hypothetical protein
VGETLAELYGEVGCGELAYFARSFTASTVNRASWRSRDAVGSEGVRGGLPLLEASRDELRPLLLAPAVQQLEV